MHTYGKGGTRIGRDTDRLEPNDTECGVTFFEHGRVDYEKRYLDALGALQTETSPGGGDTAISLHPATPYVTRYPRVQCDMCPALTQLAAVRAQYSCSSVASKLAVVLLRVRT